MKIRARILDAQRGYHWEALKRFFAANGYTVPGQAKVHPGGWPGMRYMENPQTGDRLYIDEEFIYNL